MYWFKSVIRNKLRSFGRLTSLRLTSASVFFFCYLFFVFNFNSPWYEASSLPVGECAWLGRYAGHLIGSTAFLTPFSLWPGLLLPPTNSQPSDVKFNFKKLPKHVTISFLINDETSSYINQTYKAEQQQKLQSNKRKKKIT